MNPQQQARFDPPNTVINMAQAFRARPLALLCALLVACGGGGGGDPAPSPAPAAPQGVDAQAVHASGATLVTTGCNGGETAGTLYVDAEVEPFVTVNPRDGHHLVAAWQQDRGSGGAARAGVVATSFDGGRSWSRQLAPFSRCGGAAAGQPGNFARATDPWVDFGPDGTVHLMGLALTGGALVAGSSSAMLASRSTDGGRTWGTPQRLVLDGDSLFNDKNSLTADPTDPRFVYTVWDRVDRADNGPTLLARSSTGGASWEPAREIYVPRVPAGSVGSPQTSQTIGNRVAVRPDGTLLNLFTQIDTVAGRSESWLGVLRSADKGLSWSVPIRIAALQAVGAKDPQTGKAIRDGAILASIVVAPDGTVWVAWQDARFSGGARDAIALSRSTDGGLTWTAPVAVNRAPGAAAFTPSLAVRGDGTLALLHYDLRDDTADATTLLTSAWLLTSRDRGQTWAETRVREAFDLNGAPDARGWFLGDYQGLVASGEAFVPVFGVSGGSSIGRTDIVALRVLPPLASGAAGRPGPLSAPQAQTVAVDEAAFRQARHLAIQRALQQRRPGR